MKNFVARQTYIEEHVLLALLVLAEQSKDIDELAMGTKSVRDQGEQMLNGLLLDTGGVGTGKDGVRQLHLDVASGIVGDRTTLQRGADQLPVLVLLQLIGRHNQQLLLRAGRDVAPVQAATLVQQGGTQTSALTAGIEVATAGGGGGGGGRSIHQKED